MHRNYDILIRGTGAGVQSFPQTGRAIEEERQKNDRCQRETQNGLGIRPGKERIRRREKPDRLDHRVRKRADSNIVQRHATRGDTPVNQASNAIFDEVLGTINAAIRDPISVTEVILDVRSSSVRLNHPGAH